MLNAKFEITEDTILCLYLACWKLYFSEVIPAFICSSHLATHCFLPAALFSVWEWEVSLSFLPDLLCPHTHPLGLSFPPSILLQYLWQLMESDKLYSRLIYFCGSRYVSWVTSCLHLSSSRINWGWGVPIFIHSFNKYLLTAYCV